MKKHSIVKYSGTNVNKYSQTLNMYRSTAALMYKPEVLKRNLTQNTIYPHESIHN